MAQKIDAGALIDRLGGTSAVARICECTAPSVHQWRKRGIPKPRLQFLKIAYPKEFAEVSGSRRDLVEPAKEGV